MEPPAGQATIAEIACIHTTARDQRAIGSEVARIMEQQAGQGNGGTQAQAGQDNDGIVLSMQAPAGQRADYPEQLNGVMNLSHSGASQHELNMALMTLSPAVQGVAIHNMAMYVCLHRRHALIVLRCRKHNAMLHHDTREHITNSHDRMSHIRDAICECIDDSDTEDHATVEAAFNNEWQYAASEGSDAKSENRRNEV